ncbi:hypothetical protein DRO42_00580 [Candidatus Bathyarchaeota archaeon]|nr:MAG: hypothetical protein DRO42_00580 [Candidatus Bathyarchaeota archaeon]
MTRVEIAVEAVVNPTESVEKVERAVRNVLGDVDLKQHTRGNTTVLECHMNGVESLRHLREQLRRARIRGAARALLTRSTQGSTLIFGLNRQAAYAGRVSFYHSREAPLGPIKITIRGDVDAAIRYLCEQ